MKKSFKFVYKHRILIIYILSVLFILFLLFKGYFLFIKLFGYSLQNTELITNKSFIFSPLEKSTGFWSNLKDFFFRKKSKMKRTTSIEFDNLNQERRISLTQQAIINLQNSRNREDSHFLYKTTKSYDNTTIFNTNLNENLESISHLEMIKKSTKKVKFSRHIKIESIESRTFSKDLLKYTSELYTQSEFYITGEIPLEFRMYSQDILTDAKILMARSILKDSSIIYSDEKLKQICESLVNNES
jgi:hypothetical protein